MLRSLLLLLAEPYPNRQTVDPSLQPLLESARALTTFTHTCHGNATARALSRGVQEALEKFRSCLIALESSAVLEEGLVLSNLRAALNEANEVLPRLHVLARKVSETVLPAPAVTRMLRAEASCGLPATQAAMQICERHVNSLLLRCVSAWMVHGKLRDGRQGFFIIRRTRFMVGAQRDDARASMGRGALDQPDSGSTDDLLKEWVAHAILPEALPPAVSAAAAEDILFAGNTARLLLNPPAGAGVTSEDLLPAIDRRACATALAKLAASALRRGSISAVAAVQRRRAAMRLWRLMTGHAALDRHLETLRCYFLMARGELYHALLESAGPLLSLPPRPATAEADLQAHLSAARVRSGTHEDKLGTRVSIMLVEGCSVDSDAASDGTSVLRLPSLDGWDGVYLKYSPDWPLQLLLTPEAMRVYNAIFRYLFRLRRLHMALDGAWRVASGSPSWHLRQHMAYLVSNLQYYLQIDVIDTQSTVLNTAIAQATDFTELRTAHEAFLGALVAQSFLDVPPISVQIERLFALCLSLCGIVQRTDVEGREACSSQGTI